jgi:hypothetical protein
MSYRLEHKTGTGNKPKINFESYTYFTKNKKKCMIKSVPEKFTSLFAFNLCISIYY